MISLLATLIMSLSTFHVIAINDGDTVTIEGGTQIRMIGVDAPESFECGYHEAKTELYYLLKSNNYQVLLRNPTAVPDTDDYGRDLRYVDLPSIDIGAALIRKGVAIARYDSLDGYAHHPRQRKYRRLDKQNPDICPMNH